MNSGFKSKVASILAAFAMTGLLISAAHAGEIKVSPPELASDPVVLHLADSKPSAIDPADQLQVFIGVADSCCEGRIPITGQYTRAGTTVAFLPAFGFEPGQNYMVRVLVGTDDPTLVRFRIPTEALAQPAAVTGFYPSGETLPENTLRFYIHFSVPMKPHVAFDYITLRDASGKADEAAFMRFKQELWNEDRTRLTVLIDPGRIKRDVATNVELGPALLAGRQYTLSVDSGWPSADGASVLPAFRRSFIVSDALRARPDMRLWTVNALCAGTQEPLTITFDRSFDRHRLTRALRVETETLQLIEGVIQITDAEHSWIFTPHRIWPSEDLQVVLDSALEDVAGNNFRDLLDHVAGSQEADPSPTILPISMNDCAS